ncbi:transposase domain-containing protein [Streptomyces sp. DSM 41634]|uniref:transposase domain-containing protein n=1 Tax=Streptomyces sp. DSM 41634 TaxID=3448656 RepID=UPI0028836E73|nr:transposase domain-containing protein [Streptomyces sp. DSM 41633]
MDEVMEHSGRTECRRRLLPARTVVYFVLALCLFSSFDSTGPPRYRSVLRTLTEKLRHLPGMCVERLPTSSALTRAGQRLGAKPLQCSRDGAARWPRRRPRARSGSGWSPGRAPRWMSSTPPPNARQFGFTGRDGVNQSEHRSV